MFYSGIDAANKYLILLLVGIVWFAVAIIYIKDKYPSFHVFYPIEDDNGKAIKAFFIGLVAIIALVVATNVFSFGYNVTSFTKPLNNFELTTFGSDWWLFHIIGVTAPVIEEIVLGCFFVIGSLMFGFLLLYVLNVRNPQSSTMPYIIAIILSTILFSAMHYFNGTYRNTDGTINIAMFMYAAMFRLILNTIIYIQVGFFKNLGLSFSIGVHMGNNMMALGLAAVGAALFTTWQGILFSGILILLVIGAVTNHKNGRGAST